MLYNLHVNILQIFYPGMLKWVKHDLDSRADSLAELLHLVRLNLLTVEDLIEKIECEPLIMSNADCNRILHNVGFYYYFCHLFFLINFIGPETNKLKLPPQSYYCCNMLEGGGQLKNSIGTLKFPK